MIDNLIKLANHLDERGLYSEVNHLDKIIVIASAGQSILSKLMDIENGIRELTKAARKLVSHNIDYESPLYYKEPLFSIFDVPKKDIINNPYKSAVYTYAYHLYYLNEDIKKLSELKHGFSFVNNDLKDLTNKLREFFNAANTLRLNRLNNLFKDGEKEGQYHIRKEVLRLNKILRKAIYKSEYEMSQFSEYEEEKPARITEEV